MNRSPLISLVPLLSLITFASVLFAQTIPDTAYLSDMTWNSATGACYRNIQKDKMIMGDSLKVAGITYPKGIGTNCNSEITYNLNGGYTTFDCVAGVDDKPGTNKNAVTFEVWDQNRLRERSDTLHIGDSHLFHLNVQGWSKLVLKTVSNPGGIDDFADWADAKLSNGTPPPVAFLDTAYLSDITIVPPFAQYPPKMDQSCEGNPIKINGVSYVKGIGVLGNTDIKYALTGLDYTLFSSTVGLDGDSSSGSATFMVLNEHGLVASSGKMLGGQTHTFNIDISGWDTLRLVILGWGWAQLDFGDSGWDSVHVATAQGDWGNALLTIGSAPRVDHPIYNYFPVIYYDYPSDFGQANFEHISPEPHLPSPGMVQDTLDSDRKPMLKADLMFNNYLSQWFRPSGSSSIGAQFLFDSLSQRFRWSNLVNYKSRSNEWIGGNWTRSDSMANIVIYDSLKMTYIGDSSFELWTTTFYPLDNRGFGTEPQLDPWGTGTYLDHNFTTAMEIHNRFTYEPGMFFSLVSEDDTWAYVNDKLCIDLGGFHPRLPGSINFDTLHLTPDSTYWFDLFICDRRADWATGIYLKTNIQFREDWHVAAENPMYRQRVFNDHLSIMVNGKRTSMVMPHKGMAPQYLEVFTLEGRKIAVLQSHHGEYTLAMHLASGLYLTTGTAFTGAFIAR